ncbi:FAD-binding protein [Gemmobacter lanyuensis]
MAQAAADYIIVGGGSAGCLVAARLIEAGATVLLLEEGPPRGHPLLDLPAGYMKFLNSERYLKYYPTVPQPQLDGRSLIIPQGRLLGAALRSTPWSICAASARITTAGPR